MYVCVCVYNEFLELPRGITWVCGRSLAEIVGSNSAEGMDVCMYVVRVMCCQLEISATG